MIEPATRYLSVTFFRVMIYLMKKQKHKSFKNALTTKNIFASLLIILFWWVFWLGTQALFMVDVPFLSSLLISSNPQSNFIFLTLWIIMINIIALVVWHWRERDYSFLKIKDKWDILGYIVPLLLIIALLATKSTSVIQYVGAKTGILYQNAELHSMPMSEISMV
jgi:hypothetical protein